jgi:hypothetical protein
MIFRSPCDSLLGCLANLSQLFLSHRCAPEEEKRPCRGSTAGSSYRAWTSSGSSLGRRSTVIAASRHKLVGVGWFRWTGTSTAWILDGDKDRLVELSHAPFQSYNLPHHIVREPRVAIQYCWLAPFLSLRFTCTSLYLILFAGPSLRSCVPASSVGPTCTCLGFMFISC